MKTLTINDLHRTDALDSSAMARIAGGEKTQASLPKEKTTKLTYVNGTIIGEWANGVKM